MHLVAPKGLLRFVPLALATVVVGLGAYFVGYSAINDMQRSHAEYVATSFGKYLVQELAGLQGMIEGDYSPATTAAAIGAVQLIGTVFEFRIFDRDGALRADSTMFSKGLTIGHNVGGRSESALALLATGRKPFRLVEGEAVNRPTYYSEIMVPLELGSRTIGVLQVVSDETENWPALFEQFRNVLLQVLALIAVAFAVPGVLYLRRTRQLDRAASSLRRSTQYDELTGCLNRATFTRIVADLMESAGARGLSVAVHFIDLDRFNDINESRGHAVGDEVLRATAQRLQRLIGTRERIARLGADEFAICQPYFINSPEVVAELASDVIRVISQPLQIGADDVQLGASVGYALFPRDGKTVAELMRAADIAIHKVKEGTRGTAVAFDPAMEAERQRRLAIEARLRTALVDNEFDIHFQPLYEIASSRLRGFEALLRLSGSDGKPISPVEFIPIAEEVGLIGDIGLWVLRESCRMAKQWPADLTVSVNLSPAQFAAGGMARQLAEVLEWSGLPPQRLELEVTESLLIAETEKVLQELTDIKALGISIALDDFGTGYSSLSYLWRFPFDKLKVDKSFMTDLAVEGSKSREILSTIIALGKVLDLKVTAEGVETEEQARVLRELRCDLVQGYLFGRPMRAIDVAATVMADLQPAPPPPGKARQLSAGAA